jgi:adenylate kinase family enzyme
MRIVILGNSGSGKSTLAREFAASRYLTALDLDAVAWERGKIGVPRNTRDAIADVHAFCNSTEQWVIEGCYASLAQAALEWSPVLLFLEPGVDICLNNCRNRPWEPHKFPSKQEQDDKLDFLLSWVREYYERDDDHSLAAHQQLFAAYAGRKYKLTQSVDQQFVDDLMLATP